MVKKKGGAASTGSGGKKKKRAGGKVGSKKTGKVSSENTVELKADGIVDSKEAPAKEVSKTTEVEEPTLGDLSSFSSMAAGPGTSNKIQGTGRLGLGKRREPLRVTSKTAADFIAEGIVDDVDEDTTSVDEFAEVAKADKGPPDFATEDIRYGIGDVADPFLAEEKNRTAAVDTIAEEEDTGKMGRSQDITGDGGVLKRLVTVGRGEVVSAKSTVTVTYTGKLEDGSVFDSTGENDSFSFKLGAGEVIKGWDAGVATMRCGETSTFEITPRYAYGRRGMPPAIPGNATLIFEITVTETEGSREKEIKNITELNPKRDMSVADIARDYGELLETQAERKKKMSLFDRFYIISPFASQTGEKPPWWLDPTITFVGIFALVGVAFYFVFVAGAIHQGVPDVDTVDVNIFN